MPGSMRRLSTYIPIKVSMLVNLAKLTASLKIKYCHLNVWIKLKSNNNLIMEETAQLILNAFQWIVRMEYALEEKKENHAQSIQIVTPTCIANKTHHIHILVNAKTCFHLMNLVQTLFNVSIHFIVGIQLLKKAQTILNTLWSNAYLFFPKIQKRLLDGDGLME